MNRCGIALETLADYQAGRADEKTAVQIREHLDRDCVHCRQYLAWMERTVTTLRQAHAVQVPERALTRAGAIFRDRFRPAVVANSLTSWLARLQFDSRSLSAAPAGARGAKHAGVQLVYTTSLHDIELFQEPNGRGDWVMIGQVMPREGDATIVLSEIVLTERNGTRLTFTPETEEFHLPAVPAGLYEIALRLRAGEITIPDVGIGQ